MSPLLKTTFAALIVVVAFLVSTVSGQSVTQPSKLAKEPTLRIEGLHAFTREDVLDRLRDRRVWLAKNGKLTSEVSAKAVTVLKEALESIGYMQANVEALQNEETNTLTLLVFEGPQFSISEIRFAGNKIFSSQELAARMQGFMRGYERVNNVYNQEIFDVCLRRLADFVRSRGYFQARFGEPKKEITEGGLVITVPVEEGILYRLGEIKIDGAHNLTEQQVRAMLSLNRGDIADGEAIGKWLFDDVKALYGEMGYIDYTAEPEPDFKVIDNAAKEGVVDFKVTIYEGSQFRIRSIKFEGSDLSDQDLGKLLLIRAGDIFNNQFFEKSVQQLNDTKRFEKIEDDFRMDQEANLLDITFKLKRVQTP